MERIIIEVADDAAKKWRLSSPEKKDRILQKMNVQRIEELLKEILEEILGEDDWTFCFWHKYANQRGNTDKFGERSCLFLSLGYRPFSGFWKDVKGTEKSSSPTKIW